MLPNCPEFLWVIWGLGKIGAVAVPLNTAVKGDLLRYFLDQSDASCVIVDDECVDRVAALAPSLNKVRSYVYRGEREAARCDLVSTGLRAHPLTEIVSPDESRPPLERVRHDDTHLIMYTSGTTGPSKGVMCPQSQGHVVGSMHGT